MLAALTTCDPGDIAASIRAAKQHRVRVSGARRCRRRAAACEPPLLLRRRRRRRRLPHPIGRSCCSFSSQAARANHSCAPPPHWPSHTHAMQWWGWRPRCMCAAAWPRRPGAPTRVRGVQPAAAPRALAAAPARATRAVQHRLPTTVPPAHHRGPRPAVAMNEGHLQELVLEHAVPPPAPPGASAVSLVRMGFPARNPEAPGAAAFCGAWRRAAGWAVSGLQRPPWLQGLRHPGCTVLPPVSGPARAAQQGTAAHQPPSLPPRAGEECLLQPGGFTCPKCKARVTELPSQVGAGGGAQRAAPRACCPAGRSCRAAPGRDAMPRHLPAYPPRLCCCPGWCPLAPTPPARACPPRLPAPAPQCHVCGLSLVSSPHLARSYHHLFPVKPFVEVPAAELEAAAVSQAELGSAELG